MPYFVHDKSEPLAPDFSNALDSWSSREYAVGAVKRGKNLTFTFRATEEELSHWHRRERERFERGEYVRVPWHDEQREDIAQIHYVHLSLEDIGKVAFTPDVECGLIDKQTRMSPGRYLERFYLRQFTKKQVAAYVDLIKSLFSTFSIATTTADIRKVYRNGPPSCMGGPADHTNQYWREDRLEGHMPCDVYAAPSDLAVAYFGPIDRPAQRATIWPEKKLYSRDVDGDSRVYGTGPLEMMLKKAGYTHGAFEGAKILNIKLANGKTLLPYIDGSNYVDPVDDDPRFLVITDEGNRTFDASRTDGAVVEINRPRPRFVENDDDDDSDYRSCDNCGDIYDPQSEGTTEYCQSCNENQWTCERCDRSGFGPDDVYCVDDQTVCEYCYQAAHTECADENCRNRWIESEAFTSRQIAERRRKHVEDLCRSCASEYAYCEACDESWDTREHETCLSCNRQERCKRTASLPLDLVG